MLISKSLVDKYGWRKNSSCCQWKQYWVSLRHNAMAKNYLPSNTSIQDHLGLESMDGYQLTDTRTRHSPSFFLCEASLPLSAHVRFLDVSLPVPVQTHTGYISALNCGAAPCPGNCPPDLARWWNLVAGRSSIQSPGRSAHSSVSGVSASSRWISLNKPWQIHITNLFEDIYKRAC